MNNTQIQSEITIDDLARMIATGFQEASRDLNELRLELKNDINNLEIKLTDNINAFKKEMYLFRDEMYAFKDEMYAFKDEMYVFRKETKAEFRELQTNHNEYGLKLKNHEKRICRTEIELKLA